MIALNNLRSSNASADSTLDSVQDNDNNESFATRATRTSAEVAKDNSYEAMVIAKEALNNATLISPFSGTVIDTNNLVPGQVLTTSDLASKYIRVIDMESLYFEAELDEIDYEKVSIGQFTDIEIDAYPGLICKGNVSEISRQGNRQSGGVTNVLVKVSFDESCILDLLTEFSGQARFVTSQKENVLSIPKKYIVIENGSQKVWLKTGSSVNSKQLVEVETGIESASEIEVTSGLSEGDEIIFIPAN
jgi:HlyD family secretion protein